MTSLLANVGRNKAWSERPQNRESGHSNFALTISMRVWTSGQRHLFVDKLQYHFSHSTKHFEWGKECNFFYTSDVMSQLEVLTYCKWCHAGALGLYVVS